MMVQRNSHRPKSCWCDEIELQLDEILESLGCAIMAIGMSCGGSAAGSSYFFLDGTSEDCWALISHRSQMQIWNGAQVL